MKPQRKPFVVEARAIEGAGNRSEHRQKASRLRQLLDDRMPRSTARKSPTSDLGLLATDIASHLDHGRGRFSQELWGGMR